MCTELLLAIVYFLIIGTINFFLYKLLVNYYRNIIKQRKIKTIFSICNIENPLFPFLYNYIDQENRKIETLQYLNNCTNITDTLIIGKIYKELEQYSKSKGSFDNLFFKLLENQYLKKS